MASAMTRALRRVAAVMAAATAAVAPTALQADDFYKGKQITLLIPFAAGSGYDTYGRALVRYLGQYVPGNPTVVASIMTGGGGLVLANHVYNVAAKDGTTLGLLSRSNNLDPLMGDTAARFDPRRFSWIGSMGDEVSICAAWHTSGFSTWEDLTRKEFIATSSGAAADNNVYPLLFNALLGTRFRVVIGYKGGPEMNKATEDGEANGRCGWSWTSVKTSKPDWLADNKIRLLLQAGLKKSKELPDVPLVLDLARTPEDRQGLELAFSPQAIAWGIVGPPGMPAEQVAVLRKAFMTTLADKGFLADAQRLQLDIDPMTGDDAAKVVDKMYTVPQTVVDRVRHIMKPGGK